MTSSRQPKTSLHYKLLVVSDATSEYTRLREAGLRIVDHLREQPWEQRRFIGVDPTGSVMTEVLEVIGPPSPEFLAQKP